MIKRAIKLVENDAIASAIRTIESEKAGLVALELALTNGLSEPFTRAVSDSFFTIVYSSSNTNGAENDRAYTNDTTPARSTIATSVHAISPESSPRGGSGRSALSRGDVVGCVRFLRFFIGHAGDCPSFSKSAEQKGTAPSPTRAFIMTSAIVNQLIQMHVRVSSGKPLRKH